MEFTKASLGQVCKTKQGTKGIQGVKFQCCVPAADATEIDDSVEDILEETLPEPKCYVGGVGSPGTCTPAAELKAAVYKSCGGKGGVVTAAKMGQACKGKGFKGYESAKFQCCVKPTLDDAGSDDPTDIDDGMSCKPGKIEVDTCMGTAAWKGHLTKVCGMSSAKVGNVSLGNACKGGFAAAKFECCIAD